MSTYKTREDYFEMIAHKNILIAHNRPIEGTEKTRKSFFRVNSEDELNAACVNWAHFPCVAHIGHDINYKQVGAGLPRKNIGNHLLFLSRIQKDGTGPTFLANAIDQAYQEAEASMEQFLSYMNEEMEAGNRCGELFLFDVNKAHAEQYGPIQQVLYGWNLSFYDEVKADAVEYDETKWYND